MPLLRLLAMTSLWVVLGFGQNQDLSKPTKVDAADRAVLEPSASIPAPAAVPAPPARVIGSQERAFILDEGTNKVIALDTKSVTVLGTASVEGGHLTSMIQIPHSKRLAVFDRGQGKGTLAYGWHPEGKASMSFIDMDSMKITSRLELGWGIGPFLITRDGKGLAVLCPGYASNKPEETLPAEVIFIDIEKSQITGRIPVNTPIDLLLTSDNRTLITFTSAWHDKKTSRNAEVQFVEFGTGKVLGKLLPSKAVTSAELSADGQFLYLLDPGEPSDKIEKNMNGFLVITSVPTRSELSSTDVGSAPRELIHDRGSDRILILSDAAPAKKHEEAAGAMSVFKGAEAIAVTPVAHSPELLVASPNGSALYVGGSDSVSVIDSSNLKATAELPIKGTAGDLAITADGKRGIVSFPEGDRVTVLDLEQKKSLATLTTGRSSQRFMKAAAAGANAFAQEMENYNSYFYAQENANATGETQYYTVRHYNAPPAPPAHVSVAISADGKFAYAVNDQTRDVTIIDAQAATVLSKDKIPSGYLGDPSWKIETIPSANAIAVVGWWAITFFDTKTNQRIDIDGNDRLKAGGLAGVIKSFQLSPSGTRACALVSKRIICLDTSTMKEAGRQENFKQLQMMLFEKQ